MPNKRERSLARTTLDELGFCPLRHLVGITRSPLTPPDLAADCCKALLPYAFPRLAQIEVQNNGPVPQAVNVNIHRSLMRNPAARAIIESAVFADVAREREARALAAARPAVLDAEFTEHVEVS